MIASNGDIEDFLSRVDMIPECGCWIWRGAANSVGYGRFTINRKRMGAHRASMVLHHGGITKGMQINHKCNIRMCVNPAHLYEGTAKENTADMFRAGRNNHANGERVARAKLKESDIPIIRAMQLPIRKIAKIYDIAHNAIWEIKHRKTWKHVK